MMTFMVVYLYIVGLPLATSVFDESVAKTFGFPMAFAGSLLWPITIPALIIYGVVAFDHDRDNEED